MNTRQCCFVGGQYIYLLRYFLARAKIMKLLKSDLLLRIDIKIKTLFSIKSQTQPQAHQLQSKGNSKRHFQ